MVDSIKGINSLINKSHCRDDCDIIKHSSNYFDKSINDGQQSEATTSRLIDPELEAIFNVIEDVDDIDSVSMINPPHQSSFNNMNSSLTTNRLLQHQQRFQSNNAPQFTDNRLLGTVYERQNSESEIEELDDVEDDIIARSISNRNNENQLVCEQNMEDDLRKKQSNTITQDGIRAVLDRYEHNKADDVDYEHIKYVLIDEIEEFQDSLFADEIIPQRIYSVNIDTPLHKLREIRNTLKVKFDRTRFTNTGIKAIEFTALVMEKIFDGTRSIGSFNLNLKGWSKCMKLRSKYMRTDLMELVETYISPSMTPGVRIFTDIMLNMIIYGTTNSMSSTKTSSVREVYDKLQ